MGAFSDFEGSARKGIRFPGHAVTCLRINPQWEALLGIEYLDRDDISLLPVAGVIIKPSDYLRLEAVFPRPRAVVQIMNSDRWLYLSGKLGGGTWAVERVDLTSDNATYRDLRLVLGVEYSKEDLHTSSLEIGYVFNRRLSYRSAVGDYSPSDRLVLQINAQY